jgi:ABC-type glycerol-3-phosphate transport system substrate-binding protein
VATPVAGDAARRRVVMATPWRIDGRSRYERLLGRFVEAHPEVALEPVPLPIGDLATEFAGGRAPDAAWIDGPSVVELGARGVLGELSGRIGADGLGPGDFWAPAWAQGRWRGRTYGLPVTADPNFLLFRDRRAGEPELVPWAVYGAANALFTWAGAYGGVLHDAASERVTADDPGTVAALEWMTAEARRLGVKRIDALLKWEPTDVRHPFVLGKLAVAPLGSWELPDVRRSGIDYEVAPLPSGAEWVGGWHLGLPTRGRDPDEAWRFARWITATREGAQAQGELNGAFSGYRDNPWLPVAERDPDLTLFAAVLRRATRHRPAHPAGGLFMELLDQAADDAIRGRKPPAEALAMVSGATQRKLDARKRGISLP